MNSKDIIIDNFTTIYYREHLKPLIDKGLALIGLVILSPIMIIVAAYIRLTSKGDILFVHNRVGKNGQVFNLYKFRTMVPNAEDLKKDLQALNERDGPVFKMKDDPRVIRGGRFLRKYALDELPQLLNILLGEMSVVGPRPATIDEVSQYLPSESDRLKGFPGLTCTWQTHPNKDTLPFSKQVELDTDYLSDITMHKDMKLIIRTIPYILFGAHKG